MENNANANEVYNAQFGEQQESVEDKIQDTLDNKRINDLEQSTEDKKDDNEDVDFNKKFAALSRREKEIREREQIYDRKLQELQEKIELLQNPKEPEPEKEPELPLEYRLKRDPLNTLKEMGLDYNTLAELALNDGKLTTDMQMQLMREEIKKEMEEKYGALESKLTEKEIAEAKAREEREINNFKMEISNVIEKDPEKFELIRANNEIDTVFQVIEEHYKETNRILDIEEAANAVESHLLEEAQKLLKLNKISKIVGGNMEQSPEKRQESFTLSNNHSATVPNSSDSKLSREESIQKAASLLKFTWFKWKDF